MVRLKDDVSSKILYTVLAFQYLYGAVKSIELQIASALAVAFQYLYGAVKRGVAVLQQAMSV
ncbi:hypothetical protein HX057_11605 [Myroides odoratimimus]|uniref:hypothetical protein n=1 Tax=Myroides odoratimimus TaxID=76832 RepID=UPI00103DF94B|nr:hypothetical protein [Myroides odoratimimus]MCO7724393.1 hypothetical protein [Myroides odoratimimus]MCS7473032.1 hypothetical protein [Myroides odoratimimus]MDM1035684.1 hypothetical protein [Myroides odoratimimus]MDM1414877.1 hypothetical protein [Myroides odoratimimus]MDM1447395.1 hypothetical protein [Myroides odoratimimus]